MADDDYVGHGLEVGGEQLEFYFGGMLTPVFNVMSRCPVLDVPSGSPTTACPPGFRSRGAPTTTSPCSGSAPRSSSERPWLDVDERRPTWSPQRGMSALLEIEGLTVRLPVEGELRTVLHDVSLTVGAGEAVGLVGESGSGKSMTARAIARLLPAGAQVDGARRASTAATCSALRGGGAARATASEIAIVFQDPRAHVNPVRTIGDFMTEALRMHGVARVGGRQDARSTLLRRGRHRGRRAAAAAVPARAVRRPAAARHDRHRAAGRAAADARRRADHGARRDDAGRGHGDPRRAAPERGLALLFITHDLDLAAAVCDRTAVMYAGQIVETQRRATLLARRPLHPYTAALAAARPDIAPPPTRLAAIPGRPVRPSRRRDGCAFAPRCGYAQDACRGRAAASRAGGGVRCPGPRSCRRARR